MTFVGNLGYVAIVVIGGFLTISRSMTIGGMLAFIQYARQFDQPISQIANISNVLQQTATAERVFEFLGEEEEMPDGSDALSIVLSDSDETDTDVRIDGGVKFDHVSFGYKPDNLIINDFSIDIKPGQKIAIVG